MWSARWFRGPVAFLTLVAASFSLAQEPKGRPDLSKPLPYRQEKSASSSQKEFAPDRLIVRFRADKSTAARAAVHTSASVLCRRLK